MTAGRQAPERVMRRVRAVVGTAGNETLGGEGLRTLVRELVLDGGSVPDWHMRAACAGMDEETFFPPSEAGGAGARWVQEAKAVCAGCPVRSACLADAMARESEIYRFGVVGGLSATERTRLHRQLREQASAEDPGAVA